MGEFVNRIDVVITYQPLDADALGAILDHHIAELQEHVHTRLGERSFELSVTPSARQLLLDKGTSERYGARELNRTIHRMLTQPLAALVAGGDVAPAGVVRVDVAEDGGTLTLQPHRTAQWAGPAERSRPCVLALDENAHLLKWLEQALAGIGVALSTAATAERAREIVARQRPDLVIVDLVLPDGDGLSVALELLRLRPRLQIVVTTGTELSADESALCEWAFGFGLSALGLDPLPASPCSPLATRDSLGSPHDSLPAACCLLS